MRVDVFPDGALEVVVRRGVVGGVDAAEPGGLAPGNGVVDVKFGVDGHDGGGWIFGKGEVR